MRYYKMMYGIKVVCFQILLTLTLYAGPVDYPATISELFALKIVPGRSAFVEDLILRREQAGFELHSGNIQLLSKVNDRTIAVLFSGQGTFRYAPPGEIERAQLNRFYGSDSLNSPFRTLMLLFNDSTLEELENLLDFSGGEDIRDSERILEDILEYMSDEDGPYFKSPVLKFVLDESTDPYFYAHFYEDQGKPFIFEINPYEFESVRFMHRAELGHIYKYPEIICQYPGKFELPGQKNDVIRIDRFEIDTKIFDDLDLTGMARLTITSEKADQQWFSFNIFQKMEIDSVLLNDSIPVSFFKPEDMSVFWVNSGRRLDHGDLFNLTIYYHSDDILEKDTRSWIYLRSPLYWYPRYALWEPAEYLLSFEYPADYTLVSVGDRLDSLQNNARITTVWQPVGKTTHAVFNMGYFERYPVNRPGLPPLIIFKTGQGLLFRSRDIEKEIAEDILRSIAFYQRSFGEIPFKRLYVSEIPLSLGMAFPGLLNLSWNTFYETGIRGYDQVFRAHEVAHQWWGIEVGFETYHDQWLSEAFAEFSGLAYLRSVSQDDDRYMDMITEISELVISNRKYILSDGQEAGPVWLGTRTASTRTAGDYSLIIYKKGALVLRMLQIMMAGPEAAGDTAFYTMLQDYYGRFRGKRAATEDFIQVVSSHTQQDMHWFFDQWIYGTAIPSYTYGYRVTKTAESTYVVTLRVRQENVPASFRMPVPIEFHFEEEDLPVFRDVILVEGELSERSFTLGSEPDELIFNADNAVLSEWDETDFEDLIPE